MKSKITFGKVITEIFVSALLLWGIPLLAAIICLLAGVNGIIALNIVVIISIITKYIVLLRYTLIIKEPKKRIVICLAEIVLCFVEVIGLIVKIIF